MDTEYEKADQQNSLNPDFDGTQFSPQFAIALKNFINANVNSPLSVSQIVETTQAVAASTLSITIPARKDIQVDIYIPNTVAGFRPAIQFNGDTGNNYADHAIVNGGVTAGHSSASTLNLTNTDLVANETNIAFSFKIKNIATFPKIVHGTGAIFNSLITTKAIVVDGIWSDTSDQVTSMVLLDFNATNNIPAGTIVTIYGSMT